MKEYQKVVITLILMENNILVLKQRITGFWKIWRKKRNWKTIGGVEGFKKQLSRYHAMAKGTGQNMIKPMVEGMGFGGAVKVINLDSFTCAGGFPKYESGIAVSLKLPRTHSCFKRIIKINTFIYYSLIN